MFAAAPFEYGAQAFVPDAVARHGTTYVYDGRGKVVRTVEAFGRNEQAVVTDVAAKVYVATQSYEYRNGYIELAQQGPDELDPASARYLHRDEQTLTAIGREVRRLRRDATLAPRDRIEQVFDRLGRLTATRRFADPLSVVAAVEWTTEYDSLGNVMRMTEPGIARSMVYDEFGGLLATSWTDGGAVRSVRSAFDGFGRLTEVQRVTSTSGVDHVESSERYHYDLAAAGTAQPPMAAALLQGRLSWIESDVGTVSFGYDVQGRESGTYYEYRDVPGVIAEEATLTLGGQLRDLWLTTPWSADKVAYGYDTAGRMRTVSRDGEPLAEASANAVGQYEAVKYGNGARDFFEYAPSGRRELMAWKTETPSAAYNHEYLARDAAGRVVERREDNDGRVLQVASAYDTMGRLSAQMRDGGGPDLEMFVYDGLGNMRSRVSSLGSMVGTPMTSDADRLCRFAAVGSTGPCQVAYDGAGNVTEDTTSGAVRTFTYDAGQRVTRMTRNGIQVDVTHGPVGRAKLVVTGGPRPRTVWSFGDRIEYRVRPDKVAQVDRRIPGPLGELVSLRTELDRDGNVAAEQAVYQHGDSQANRVFTDRDGQVVQAATFDVFGGVTDGHDDGTLTGSDDLWNGGDDLPEIGVTLLGPRAYDPTLGRFLQRDPIAVMTSSSRANPYAFAFSDPENYSDPSGLCPAERPESQCTMAAPGIEVPLGEPGVPVSSGGAPAPKTALGYESLATLAAIRNESFFGTRTDFSVTGFASEWIEGRGRGAVNAVKGLAEATVDAVGCFGDIECQVANGVDFAVGVAVGGPTQAAAQLESLKRCLADFGNDCAGDLGEHEGQLYVQALEAELLPKAGRRGPRSPRAEASRRSGLGICFGAGTLVATADGPRAIETLEVGDLVWAEDERTGELALRRIARTFVTQDSGVVEVSVSDVAEGAIESIEATPGHPFWTLRGWVGARDLRPGDRLLTRAQDWRKVAGVRLLDGTQTVYNLEVEDDHTYFVGDVGYLVHNDSVSGFRPRNPNGTFAPNGGRKPRPRKSGGVHENTAGSQPAILYARYGRLGNFLKWGVTFDLLKRYSKNVLDGGYLQEMTRGPRSWILRIERWLVETQPGKLNKEPWRGKMNK